MIALYSPSIPPVRGGIADHTAALARALHREGVTPLVLAQRGSPASVAPVPARIGVVPRDIAEVVHPTAHRWLLLQFAPFLYGRRGLAPSLCRAVARSLSRGHSIALLVHEPWVPFSRLPWLVTGWPMRWQLRFLVRQADRVFTPVPAWTRRLEAWRTRGAAVATVPIGATLPTSELTRAAARAALGLDDGMVAIGLFGTSASGYSAAHARAAADALRGRADVVWVRLGYGSERPAPRWLAGHHVRRVPGTDAAAVSDAMRALDLALAPFVDGLTLRRTSAMLALAHAIPVVSTTGPLFDPEAGRLAVCEGSPEAFGERVAQLVGDPRARAAAAARTMDFEASASVTALARRLLTALREEP